MAFDELTHEERVGYLIATPIAVAATLRTAASWLPEWEREMLYAAADDVERIAQRQEPDEWRNNACCPVCQEVECDRGCPLWVVREAAGVWVGSSGARDA